MPTDLAPGPALHYRTSDQMEILREIVTPGVNLCIWERPPNVRWELAIQAVLNHGKPLALDLTAPSAAQVAEAIQLHLTPDAKTGESVVSLAEDLFQLTVQFGAIAGIRHTRLRLTRVEDDGCALFHADTLSLRLLCTYAGQGTQWLENDNVRRDELGTHGRSFEQATAAMVINPAKIRTLPRAHVAILKGRLSEGEENNALVHRSSPVRFEDDIRLRLCIDPSDSCSC